MKSRTRSLESVLSSPHLSLGSLRARVTFLQEADQTLASCIPPEIARQTRVADCSGGRLLLMVSSAAVATRLRYQSRGVAGRFTEITGIPVSEIDIRVRSSAPAATPIRYDRSISTENRRYLVETARGISDKRLADALERLSRAGK